jgi:hypothetical protein
MVGKSNMGDYGLPLWIKMLTGGVAGCISEVIFFPLLLSFNFFRLSNSFISEMKKIS